MAKKKEAKNDGMEGGKGSLTKATKKPAEYSREYVKVEFTQDEIQALGASMAQKIEALSDLEAEKATLASEFGSRIKTVSLEIKEAARKIRNGYEFQTLNCRKEYVPDQKRVDFILEGEASQGTEDKVVKSRPMHPDEFQMSLGLGTQADQEAVDGLVDSVSAAASFGGDQEGIDVVEG